VRLATIGPDGPTGGFFDDDGALPLVITGAPDPARCPAPAQRAGPLAKAPVRQSAPLRPATWQGVCQAVRS
jgi:hypothetical protein